MVRAVACAAAVGAPTSRHDGERRRAVSEQENLPLSLGQPLHLTPYTLRLLRGPDEDLLPAIRAVASGKPFFNPAVTAVLVEDYMRQLQARGLTDSYHLLTTREKEVLQLLAEGRVEQGSGDAAGSRALR